MKVKNILDYFGPRLNCKVKFHHPDSEEILFETIGFAPCYDDKLMDSFILAMDVNKDDDGCYIDFTVER